MSAIQYATKINFGIDIIKRLNLSMFKNVLVLTGAHYSLEVFNNKIAGALGGNYHLYSGIGANPTETAIYSAVSFARNKNIDCILSMGGGAVMDTGRLVSLLLSHGGLLHEYVANGESAPLVITPNLIYHVTVPTICGTGAEISASASFMLGNKKCKIFDPLLAPKETFIDPALMTDVPKKIWAAVGFECFAGALEAYVSMEATPESDALSEQALTAYVEVATELLEDTSDLVLIERFAAASINSMIAMNLSSAGAVHAIAEVLSAHFNLQHGVALAVVCAEVCVANEKHNKPKFDRVRQILKAGKKDISTAINMLIQKIGITKPVIQHKFTSELKAQMSLECLNPAMRGNPKLLTVVDVTQILNSLA